MLFTGTYDLTIDNKNRLSIPAGIRSAMDPKKDGTGFYLVPGSRRGTLGLYGDRYYEAYSEQYHASLEPRGAVARIVRGGGHCPHPASLARQAMLLQSAVERAAAQSEGIGGAAHVSLTARQCPTNHVALDFVKSHFFQSHAAVAA